MTIDLFEARALAPLVKFLGRNGLPAERLLDGQRIPIEIVEAGGWVTKKQAYDFVRDVVQHTRCPEAVFAAYVDFQLDDLGPIAKAMRSCKTVKEALDTAIQLGSFAYQGSDFRLRIEGETSWLIYSEPNTISAGQPFINDMTLMVYYHLISATTGQNWRPQRLRTKESLVNRHCQLALFEDCQTDFHPGHSALAFPTEFLSRRLPRQNSATNFDATIDWLLSPDDNEPIADAFYRLIASRFPFRKLPTLDQLALLVDLSPATIKRLLASSGTTYSKLLDRIRFDAACKMLSISELTVREIAHELGYSGTNNFVRSFRRMTGTTPGQFRRQ